MNTAQMFQNASLSMSQGTGINVGAAGDVLSQGQLATSGMMDGVSQNRIYLDQMSKSLGIDQTGGKFPSEVIPRCKPWYMMASIENFRDYLLTMQKQVWQLHTERPSGKGISAAFLDLTKLEYLLAPISGKGIHSRITKDEVDRISEIREFLDVENPHGLKGSLEAAATDAGYPTQGMDVKLRATQGPDLGYPRLNKLIGDGAVRNSIKIDRSLAYVYHGDNKWKGVMKTLENLHTKLIEASADMIRAAEPCQLSNF